MMTRLIEVQGISKAYAVKLIRCGLMTQEQLLDLGATKLGRQAIATESGIHSTLIMDWVNHADLARVKGLGSENTELLSRCGIDTVADLAENEAYNLHQKMVEFNGDNKFVVVLPTIRQVIDWVEQAKILGRAIHY